MSKTHRRRKPTGRDLGTPVASRAVKEPPARPKGSPPRTRSAVGGKLTDRETRGLHAGRVPEAAIAGGVGILCFVLGLAVASPSLSLGDAPEFTAVVKVLGVAHAPGYPAYVLGAHLFMVLVPFGSVVWRVALFSSFCAAGAAVVLFLILRRLRFSLVASVGVALLAATGRSWWYNSAFSKPYAFTELLFLGAVLSGLWWRERRGYVAALAMGACLGLASGASYQPVLLATPGLGVLLFTGVRRPRAKEVLVGLACAGVIVVSLLGYEMWRAAAPPAVNWGSATSPSAVMQLIRMTDFHFGTRGALAAPSALGVAGAAASAAANAPGRTGQGGGPFAILFNVLGWPLELVGELTIVSLVLLATGIVVWVRAPDRRRLVFVPALIFIQALGLAVAINLHPALRAGSVTAFGAFWAPATLGCLVMIGQGLDTVGRLGGDRDDWGPFVAGTAVVVAIAASATTHWAVARHGPQGMADGYGHAELASLPPRSILAVNGAEFGFPAIARQVVDDDRRDVDVVFVDLLDRPWYRVQVAGRLGLAPFPGMSGYQFLKLVSSRVPSRPLYVDGGTAIGLRGSVGLRLHGLVSEVLPTADQSVDVADTKRLIDDVYDLAPLDSKRARAWPNVPIRDEYVYAMLRYGFALGSQGDTAAANGAFNTVLRWDPGNRGAQAGLDAAAPSTSPSTSP